jgi:flavin-dependent dehydrogenase
MPFESGIRAQTEGGESVDVVIVGAGVSGETAAIELKAQVPDIKVILLE